MYESYIRENYNNPASSELLNGVLTLDLTMLLEEISISELFNTITNYNIKYLIYNNKNLESHALELARALTKDNNLVGLSLNDCFIGSKGLKALADALKNNTTLTYIDLTNSINFLEGAIAIAESLKGNTTITVLRLGLFNNDKQVLDILESNYSLVEFFDLDCASNGRGIVARNKKALIEIVKTFLKNKELILNGDLSKILNPDVNDIEDVDLYNAIKKSVSVSRIFVKKLLTEDIDSFEVGSFTTIDNNTADLIVEKVDTFVNDHLFRQETDLTGDIIN